uniref:Uncharacterized protein n=1 Tax=Rhizophora mucronata TaxID=61149 RepID=A0A2P2PMQ2_RHIMU
MIHKMGPYTNQIQRQNSYAPEVTRREEKTC